MYNIAGFTLNGIYNYFEKTSEDGENTPLFNDIELYQGGTVYSNEFEDGFEIPPMNKEDLIDEIMENSGELLTYRQNPFRFKRMVNQFFAINKHNFERIWISLWMDYSPIDNYDRHEYHNNEYDSIMTNEDSKVRRDNTIFNPSGSESDLTEFHGSEKTVETPTGDETIKRTTNTDESVTEQVAADNSSSWENSTKTTTSPAETTETHGFSQTRKTTTDFEYQNGRFDETTHSFSSDRQDESTTISQVTSGDTKDIHSGNDYLTIWAHGNIGVAKTSEIIEDEIRLRAFNFYEYVAEKFEEKLLIRIY